MDDRYKTAVPVIIMGKLVSVLGIGTVLWLIFYSDETRSFIYWNPWLRVSLIGIAITCFITTTKDIKHRKELKKLVILREQEQQAAESEQTEEDIPEFEQDVEKEKPKKTGLNGVTFNGLAGAKSPDREKRK